jgi:phytoene desaturase
MSSGNGSAKHILIVGAGPGGLTAGMLLARRGFRVTLFEKQPQVGGRNAALRFKGFTFDTGPTFLMLKPILDEVFEEADRKSVDYLSFTRLEPMYHLQFPGGKTVRPSTDHEVMREELRRNFPGAETGLDRYYRVEKRRFDLMYPCLQKDYSTFGQFFSKEFRRALPRLSLGRTLMGVLGDYFPAEQARLSFTFQAKYLGMSPWECPGAFGILSYIEHSQGVYHVRGGLSVISDAMAKVVQEHGGEIRLSTPVKRLILEGRAVRGLELENGEKVFGDEVILNADFAQAMTTLVPEGVLRRWSRKNLERRDFSCSTFMLYLGLDRLYPELPHHTIVFADDYRANVADIFRHKRLSEDNSFYIRNASVTDPTLAPSGKSAVYVLVPVPNLTSGIAWPQERDRFRQLILDTIARKTALRDLAQHIEAEQIISPDEWSSEYGVYAGATFNLAHQLTQMLYFRPHNVFEELDHCYLVGGGTHPGSGLPTIYESGRISANLISKRHNVPYVSKNLQV